MPLIIKTAGFENFLDPSGGAYLKALIMGDHGVGKTPFAANWPDPIIADCEKGVLSVASLGTPYVDINSSADMEALLDMLRREGQKPADKRRYKTLVVDTIDTYQRKLIQERLRSERKEALSGWADWGWLDGKMTALLESVLNLPMNVVVNMHTKDTSEDHGETTVLVQKARLKGDIKDAVFQDFDLIGHMEQSYIAGTGEKKGERVRVRQVRWHSEPKYPALRDRSNKLPRFTDVNFTPDDYWWIFNAITKGLDDLPASSDLETLPVEGDTDEVAPTTPPATDTGGPVEQPKLPQNKAAKKAPAAKKAAPAKKATPPLAVQKPENEVVQGEVVVADKTFTPPPVEADKPTEDPWAPPAADVTEVATDVPTTQADDAAALIESELGGQEIAVVTEPVTEVTEPVTEPEPAPAAPVEPASAKAVKRCGDQPASMVGKYDAVPGCGVELSAENAGKAQIAMMKFRTYLCNEDFAARQAAVA